MSKDRREQVNRAQVKLIRAGQTVSVEGKVCEVIQET